VQPASRLAYRQRASDALHEASARDHQQHKARYTFNWLHTLHCNAFIDLRHVPAPPALKFGYFLTFTSSFSRDHRHNFRSPCDPGSLPGTRRYLRPRIPVQSGLCRHVVRGTGTLLPHISPIPPKLPKHMRYKRFWTIRPVRLSDIR